MFKEYKTVLIVTALFAVLLIVGLKKHWSAEKAAETGRAEARNEGQTADYWTCPMHPQIRSDHSSECPICHMKLVKVQPQKTAGKEGSHEHEHNQDEVRVDLNVESAELSTAGVQKVPVETMDLEAHIPIAGRFLSAATVAFQVYESDLRYIRSGLKFAGESSFFPDAPLSGIITTVDTIVDPTSRTVRVVGNMQKGPRGLIAETTFRGDLAIQLKNVIAIPQSSVLHTGSGALVYVFGDANLMSPRSVKLGLKTDGYYEVLDGLKVGEFISSGPNFLIDSEAKIRGAGTSDHPSH